MNAPRTTFWRRAAQGIYAASLVLDPRELRRRFGAEMADLFTAALDDSARQGAAALGRFLLREAVEAPFSILRQRLAARPGDGWDGVGRRMAAALGFLMVGLLQELSYSQPGGAGWTYPCLLACYAWTGAAVALAANWQAPARLRTALFGAAGFILANTWATALFDQLFPGVFERPQAGLAFLIPFLLPVFSGGWYGVVVGLASGKPGEILRWAGLGGAAFLAGFFINRLSAALIQSYCLAPKALSWSWLGLLWLLFPYLLQGFSLGWIFRARPRQRNLIHS